MPDDVTRLVRHHGLEVHVQRSDRRCFRDQDFAAAGAELVDDLSDAGVILGVKEIPEGLLESGKTYMFFSHTTKGQPHNMPMLSRLLELGCTLLDYELVENDEGVRTIAFGRYAGLAGAIDTLWALGRRLQAEGIETPLARVRPAWQYEELGAARNAIGDVSQEIAKGGLPAAVSPLAFGVTGAGGKVSSGALEILDLLPSRRVDPDDLEAFYARPAGTNEIAIVSYGPEHLVEPVANGANYDWDEYLNHPDRYRSQFAPHLGRLVALVHGILWKEGFPKFILRRDLAALWRDGRTPSLRVITDITCDVGGSNESLLRVTDPGDPAYLYDPATGRAIDGWTGPGPMVLPVDIFPAELPKDASQHFSEVLAPLVPALAGSDPYPAELRRSIIVRGGELLTPWREELANPLRMHGRAPTDEAKP